MKHIKNLQSTAEAINGMATRIKLDAEWLENVGNPFFVLKEYKDKVLRDKATRERALERLKMRYNNQLDKLNTTRYK